jgi:Xaa-Pro dipeptidase
MNTATYPAHVAERRRLAEQALKETGFDALVIHSGSPLTYFADDQDAPFHTTPHFAHWVPLAGPGHLLAVAIGRKPVLVRCAPEDYWYEQAPPENRFFVSEFEYHEVGRPEAAFEKLGVAPAKTAFLGDDRKLARSRGFTQVNPRPLLARLDWDRSFKTPYEVACLEEATRLGARGHKAAREAFLRGASELEIHQAFVQAVGVSTTTASAARETAGCC